MDFKTNQQVLAELNRRLKEVKAYWKDELNPYLQFVVEENSLFVRYFTSDEKVFGCFRFPLDEVVESGVCQIALDDWLGLTIRWKRTGLVRLSMAYPELVVETLEGDSLRVPTHSFYFPEIPKQFPMYSELTVNEWRQLVLNQTHSLTNQHPLKEYEYVWLFEEEGNLVFQSANETEWSCSRLTLLNHPEKPMIHAFDKTKWLGLKQLVDKSKTTIDDRVQIGWNERFVVIQFPQESLAIERSQTIPCHLLNQTNWQPIFDWRTCYSEKELKKMEQVALAEAFKLGGKLPKTFFIYLNKDGHYSASEGLRLPYRSFVQCLKDTLGGTVAFGVSRSFDKMPLVAIKKTSTQTELVKFFVTQLKK